MTRRRPLRGKKLLVVSAGLAGLAACGDDGGPPDAPVANLVAPGDSGRIEDDGGDVSEDAGEAMDAEMPEDGGDSTDGA